MSIFSSCKTLYLSLKRKNIQCFIKKFWIQHPFCIVIGGPCTGHARAVQPHQIVPLTRKRHENQKPNLVTAQSQSASHSMKNAFVIKSLCSVLLFHFQYFGYKCLISCDLSRWQKHVLLIYFFFYFFLEVQSSFNFLTKFKSTAQVFL